MILEGLAGLLKPIAILVAAIILGNWFLSEAKAVRARGGPKYAVYLTLPGILVILAVLLPLIFWLATR